jgi:hypothetical protein
MNKEAKEKITFQETGNRVDINMSYTQAELLWIFLDDIATSGYIDEPNQAYAAETLLEALNEYINT